MPTRDHYAVLGVAHTASEREVHTAFRALARLHHPDTNQGDAGAETRFKRISRAYEVLGDPARRRRYDERRARGRFAGPGTDGRQSYAVGRGPLYHSDLGHHSDFYQAGDPLTVREAALLVNRDPGWLRSSIRAGRLPASRTPEGYLIRRRDVERLDRERGRRRPSPIGSSADDREDDGVGPA